ncbi:hypothetical protein VTK56DRAFT_6448 [Thermocarpiscus australiensis]
MGSQMLAVTPTTILSHLLLTSSAPSGKAHYSWLCDKMPTDTNKRWVAVPRYGYPADAARRTAQLVQPKGRNERRSAVMQDTKTLACEESEPKLAICTGKDCEQEESAPPSPILGRFSGTFAKSMSPDACLDSASVMVRLIRQIDKAILDSDQISADCDLVMSKTARRHWLEVEPQPQLPTSSDVLRSGCSPGKGRDSAALWLDGSNASLDVSMPRFPPNVSFAFNRCTSPPPIPRDPRRQPQLVHFVAPEPMTAEICHVRDDDSEPESVSEQLASGRAGPSQTNTRRNLPSTSGPVSMGSPRDYGYEAGDPPEEMGSSKFRRSTRTRIPKGSKIS